MNEEEKIKIVKTLSNLPEDMVREIFYKLTPLNLVRLGSTSKSHRNLLHMDVEGKYLEKYDIHVYRLLELIKNENFITKKINNYIKKDTPHYLRPLILVHFFNNPKVKEKIYNIIDLAKSHTDKKYFEELIELLIFMRESGNPAPKNIENYIFQ